MKSIWIIYCVQTGGKILGKGAYEARHFMVPTCFQTEEEADYYCQLHSKTKGLLFYWNKIQIGKVKIPKKKS